MALETSVAGIKLEHPVMNAAGPRCKTVAEIKELAQSSSAAVMVGSITLEPREGNQPSTGEVYWSQIGGGASLNSLGLPNGGKPYYEEHLPEMARIAHEAGKPLFVSVAGFNPAEYAELTALAINGGADMIEFNLGCPNVWAHGAQHRIACFDPALVEEILHQAEDAMPSSARRPTSIKPSPFSDPILLGEVASVVKASSIVKVVTLINTFPNAFAFARETKESAISTELSGGLAGLAGEPLKYIALGQIRQWRSLLPQDIDIIGVGGIVLGGDVRDYLKAGAVAVQLGTRHMDYGPKVFEEILRSLRTLPEYAPARS